MFGINSLWLSDAYICVSKLGQYWLYDNKGIVNWLPVQYQDNGGLVQDCSNSSALAMELLQSCTKPAMPGLSSIGIPIIKIRWSHDGLMTILSL